MSEKYPGQKLEIALVEWLIVATHNARQWENYRFVPKSEWNYDKLQTHFQNAAAALRAGKRAEGLHFLDVAETYTLLFKNKRSKLFPQTFACMRALKTPETRRFTEASATWFQLVHSWRTPATQSPRPHNTPLDMGQLTAFSYLLIGLATATGLLLPTVLVAPSERIILSLTFLAASNLSLPTYFLGRLTDRLIAICLLVLALTLGATQVFPSVTAAFFALPTLAGSLVGFLLVRHFLHRRFTAARAKHGAFACLWVRCKQRGYFEVVLTDSENNLLSRAFTRRFQWDYERYLGEQIARELRAAANLGATTAKQGEWFQCYFGLVTAREYGGKTIFPGDLATVLRCVPGVSAQLPQYLQDAPSPLAPPQYENLALYPELTVAANKSWR